METKLSALRNEPFYDEPLGTYFQICKKARIKCVAMKTFKQGLEISPKIHFNFRTKVASGMMPSNFFSKEAVFSF